VSVRGVRAPMLDSWRSGVPEPTKESSLSRNRSEEAREGPSRIEVMSRSISSTSRRVEVAELGVGYDTINESISRRRKSREEEPVGRVLLVLSVFQRAVDAAPPTLPFWTLCHLVAFDSLSLVRG
jgi:hypothetical protein